MTTIRPGTGGRENPDAQPSGGRRNGKTCFFVARQAPVAKLTPTGLFLGLITAYIMKGEKYILR